jgi:hypothetical protein
MPRCNLRTGAVAKTKSITMNNMQYEKVLEFVRSWSTDPTTPPYDVVGTTHLMLAALDNLIAHAMPHELEDINNILTEQQRHFLQCLLACEPKKS